MLLEEARKPIGVRTILEREFQERIHKLAAALESLSRERAVAEGFKVVHQWFPRKVADITEEEDAAVRKALALVGEAHD